MPVDQTGLQTKELMMIRVFSAENGYAECKVAIDESKASEKLLHEINNFWGDSKSRLREAKGDVAKAVAKMLIKHCFSLQHVNYGLNSWGVMQCFDWDKGEGQEGWPKMDGSEGIAIISCEVPEIELDFFSAEEVDSMPSIPKAPEW